jgi:bifunctional non-homologous end joining protein LigD
MTDGESATFPEWLEPMAATLTQQRFTGPEWIFERKFDGIRLLAFKQGTDVRLFSRNRLPQDLPAVARAIASLPVHDLILDGEITWDERTLTYHVFDVMWVGGRDVRSLPLHARRALLTELPLRAPLRHVSSLEEPDPWERARAEGWEGVIAKRRDSLYEHRRSPHWLKMKCEVTQEFVGTGFDTKLLLDLRARLNALEIPKAPFTRAVGLPRIGAHWVRPEIVVRVAFIEWTVHGKLRHPRLLGVDGAQGVGRT